MAEFTLNVNGRDYTVDVPPEMPLLWALRDIIGLTGTKYACGISQCGSCTVHLDGRPTLSCGFAVGDVGDRKVTTIEGLSPDASHALQEAWIAEEVPQCGYCQPGQIMAAAGLLANNSDPSDEEIGRAMARNICRCGTYDRIQRAIHRAAAQITDAGQGKESER